MARSMGNSPSSIKKQEVNPVSSAGAGGLGRRLGMGSREQGKAGVNPPPQAFDLRVQRGCRFSGGAVYSPGSPNPGACLPPLSSRY